MSLTIFTNQTSDTDKSANLITDGIIQVDISGVLGGADVLTQIVTNDGTPAIVRDLSWMTSAGDTLIDADAATKYIQKRNLKFTVKNAGGSTDITLSVTHESGDITIL